MTDLLRSRTEPVSSYELVVIYRQEMPQEKIDEAVEHISKLITTKGGVVDAVDRWGKRKLAYPIKQQLEGVYVLFKFTAGSSLVRKLTDDLRISESVLRHMAIKPDA
ncbi:MAG: 30S ribosomal protein S6 [Dehalogenimonas sp.]